MSEYSIGETFSALTRNTLRLKEASHPTKSAYKTYHLEIDGSRIIGSIDWLPDGKFKSYVGGSKRLHANLAAAIVRCMTQEAA